MFGFTVPQSRVVGVRRHRYLIEIRPVWDAYDPQLRTSFVREFRNLPHFTCDSISFIRKHEKRLFRGCLMINQPYIDYLSIL